MLKELFKAFGVFDRMKKFPLDKLPGKAVEEPKTRPLVRLPDTRRIIQTRRGLQEVVELGSIVKKSGRG